MFLGDGDSADGRERGLVRAEVAARLGVGVGVVRRLEWDRLHPVSDAKGIWRFDPAEVDALAAALPPRRVHMTRPTGDEERREAKRGRLAARVFQLFARRMSLPQIVVATRQSPETIRALYHEWMTGLDEGEWARTDR